MMKFSLERLGPNIPKKAIGEWGREIFRNERHASSHIEHRETDAHNRFITPRSSALGCEERFVLFLFFFSSILSELYRSEKKSNLTN